MDSKKSTEFPVYVSIDFFSIFPYHFENNSFCFWIRKKELGKEL